MRAATTAGPRDARRGYTLIEVMVVVTIMGVLISIPVPTFTRAIEQSKLDVAAANLRAVWCAQRYFYLENGRYGQLADLNASPGSGDDLLDPTIVSGSTFYGYSVAVAADGNSFTATAAHPPGLQCTGSISIDQTGTLTSQVYYSSRGTSVLMTPSLEPNP